MTKRFESRDAWRHVLLVATCLCLWGSTAEAGEDDWPEFRGPTGQGIAAEAKPPLVWSRTKNVVWKNTVPGRGWSSPIVYRSSVYLTTALVNEAGHPVSLRALRFDADSGNPVWNREVFARSGPSPKEPKNSHASPTPIAKGGCIYVHFGHMGTACLDEEGKILWRQRELAYEPLHGNGGSPILYEDKLIFNCDGKREPFIVAVNRHTGEVVWKTMRQTRARNKFSFSTPLLVDVAGSSQVVSPGSGLVCAYDPDNGKEIWRATYGMGFSVVPRPVITQGMVFVSSGFNTPVAYAIRVGGTGDVTDSHVVWNTSRGAPKTPSMLPLGRRVLCVSDLGIVTCWDARTGKELWRGRLGGGVSASPIFADGRVYIVGESGQTFVIAAEDEFSVLAMNDLGETSLATPAVSGRALYLRTETQLYRIEDRD